MRRVALAGLALVALSSGCVRKKNKPPPMRLVALGERHGCGQTTAGELLCWGDNARMQVGDGTRERRLLGVRPTGGPSSVRAFALGGVHSCLLGDDGGVHCWGADAPPATIAIAGATELASGTSHTCARAGDAVSCWAAGASVVTRAELAEGRKVSALGAGGARTCFAFEAPSRSVGCAAGGAALAPADGGPVLEGVAIAKLAASDTTACAITKGAELHCWSFEGAGAGTRALAPLRPARVDLPEPAVEVGLGREHACVRTRSGTVACWGRNDRHQLSDGTAEPSDRPKLIYGLLGAEQLAVSADGACARLKGGEVRCWGGNAAGELADGSTVDHDVPMPIKAPSSRP